MSKNFENEYIALTQVEVPDLWDRIEAGLTPRSAQNPEKNEASIIDFKRETVSEKETGDVKETKKKAPLYFIKKYKTVLAAAICVIVILPAAVVIGRMGIGLGGAKSESADTAADETMEYTVTSEAAAEESEITTTTEAETEEREMAEITEAMESMTEGTAESRTEMPAEMASDTEGGYVAEATEVTEGCAAEKSRDEAKVENKSVEDYGTEASGAGEVQKSQSTMEGVATEAAEEERAATISRLNVEDGTVLTHVKVQVYAREEVSSDGEAKGLGNLYRARVLEDADGLLQEGEEILIYISPLASTYWPEEEEIYDVMLEYDSTREYPFYLKSCY